MWKKKAEVEALVDSPITLFVPSLLMRAKRTEMPAKRKVLKPPKAETRPHVTLSFQDNGAFVVSSPSRPLVESSHLVTLTSPLDVKALPNEVHMTVLLMRRLACLPGQCVTLKRARDDRPIFLEAHVALQGSMALDAVVLNPDTLAILQNARCATLEPLRERRPGFAADVTVCVLQEGADLSAAFRLQLASSFSAMFCHRVVFDGLIAELSFATMKTRIRVELSEELGGLGYVDNATRVHCAIPQDENVQPCEHEKKPRGEEEWLAPWVPRPDEFGRGVTSHVLFYGGAGSGKSFSLKRFQSRLEHEGWAAIEVRAESLGRGILDTVTDLTMQLRTAREHAPCAVLLDDIDLLCDAKSGVLSPLFVTQVAYALAAELDVMRGLGILFVATAREPEALPPLLVRSGRLGRHIEVPMPVKLQDRLQILLNMKSEIVVGSPMWGPLSDEALRRVALHAHGFSPADLRSIFHWAPVVAVTSHSDEALGLVSEQDFLSASTRVRPSAMRALEVAIPSMTWDDIGGSEGPKQVLRDCAAWCLGEQRAVFEQFGFAPPRGVLLYGPPGCSKTMLAKALANECQMNFISVKGPEVYSKWVGDSEKAVRNIFSTARRVAPCVIFIDELDGMCGHRGHGGVSDRVISQLLTELDGLPAALGTAKSQAIMFVAATNRPENVDIAVLRPGRIDRRVYIGLPDSGERCAIATIGLRGVPCSPEVTPATISVRSEGYTGAEVVALCKEAAFHAVEHDENAVQLELRDLDSALEKVIPRISHAEIARYKFWGMSSK